jgi:hypothetical protein
MVIGIGVDAVTECGLAAVVSDGDDGNDLVDGVALKNFVTEVFRCRSLPEPDRFDDCAANIAPRTQALDAPRERLAL